MAPTEKIKGAAPDQENAPSKNYTKQDTKENVILSIFMTGRTLNRFEAEEYGDHCLHSTIATLRGKGYRFYDAWEMIPTRRFGNVRVKRYIYAGIPS
jgi:hypothetical protein